MQLSGRGERERLFTHWTKSSVMWPVLANDKWVGCTVLRRGSKSPPLLSQLFSSSALRVEFLRVAVPLSRMRKICAKDLQPTCNLSKKYTFVLLCQWKLAAVIAAKSRENCFIVYTRYWTRLIMYITLFLVTTIILLVKYFFSQIIGEKIRFTEVDHINSAKRFLSIVPLCGNA